MNCLSELIGLSKSQCTCTEVITGKPTDFDKSKSGYYIDEGLDILRGIYKDCGENSIWDKLIQARDRGIRRFETDLEMGFLNTKKITFQNFVGEIGSPSYNSLLQSHSNIAGIAVHSLQKNGATFKIRSLKIAVNQSITTTIYIYKNGFLQYQQAGVALIANSLTNVSLTTPQNLDVSGTDKYHIVYDLPTGVSPYANAVDCGCGGQKTAYKEFVRVLGVTTDSVTNLDKSYTNCASGISLNVSIGCNGFSWLCGINDTFEERPYSKSISYALNLASQFELLDNLLMKQDINYYTLIARESMYALRDAKMTEYKWIMDSLIQTLPSQSDCYSCKTENNIAVRPIRM